MFVLKSEFKLHEAPVYGVTSIEQYAFSASADKTVKSIDLSTGIIQPFLVRSEVSPISILAISPDLLAIGFLNGEFYLINTATRKTLFEYHFKGDGVFTFSFNASELYIGLGSGRLAILDIFHLEWLYIEHLFTDKIRTIYFDLVNHCYFIGAKDGEIVCFDAKSHLVTQRWFAHPGGVNSLLVSTKHQLISGGKDGHLRVWNGKDCIKEIPAHRGVIYGLIEIKNCIVSCSRDKSIKVWDLETLKPLQKMTFHRQSVNGLVQQNALSFVTASDDHRIAQWEYAE